MEKNDKIVFMFYFGTQCKEKYVIEVKNGFLTGSIGLESGMHEIYNSGKQSYTISQSMEFFNKLKVKYQSAPLFIQKDEVSLNDSFLITYNVDGHDKTFLFHVDKTKKIVLKFLSNDYMISKYLEQFSDSEQDLSNQNQSKKVNSSNNQNEVKTKIETNGQLSLF